MIQLKPGLQPATLAKNRKSLSRRPKSRRKKNRGLRFERVFSDPAVKPFDQIEWERRTAEITDDTGKVIFKQENVEVPEIVVAAGDQGGGFEIFLRRSNGTPAEARNFRPPIDPSRLPHDCRLGHRGWLFQQGEDGEIFYDELTWLCVNQYGAFNSPGLVQRRPLSPIRRRQELRPRAIGFTIARPAKPNAPPTQYEYPQGSACFIQSVDDNMEDIMRLAYSEAMLFKYGSGTGTDLSPIRSSKEKLSGGGRPSGPLSFLKVYDQVANVVKSGGKTRRAAKMNTLRDWHGDIEEFIDAKQKEEKKAWALIEQGYDGSYNGDAYGSVMYQNENLSVRVSDEFMQAAIEGKEWWTRAVTTGKPLQKKDARTLLQQDRRRHLDLRRSRACSTTAPSKNGTPAKAPSRFIPPIPARNTFSSTTPPAISPR